LTQTALHARLSTLGRELGEREAEHGEGLERARKCVEACATRSLGARGFPPGAASAGAPHLRIELSPVRTDDKHLRSVEFELWRGRYRAIVTRRAAATSPSWARSAPGRPRGPARASRSTRADEVSGALVSFLESFLEEAATP
jgi:hypothetical protein